MTLFKTRTLALICICLMLPLTAVGAECPYQLLWQNGSLWAYSTVKCESPRNCNVPTNIVLIYDHQVESLGCKQTATECECRLADADNDYLFRVIIEGGASPNTYEIDPDLIIQNGASQFIDAFNIPIQDSEDYYQCIEFRFSPDPTKPAQNMRIAVKLKANPTQYLVNESVTLDSKYLVRNVAGTNVKYQLLKSGRMTLEDVPPPPPVENTPSSNPQEDNSPPVPDTSSDADSGAAASDAGSADSGAGAADDDTSGGSDDSGGEKDEPSAAGDGGK